MNDLFMYFIPSLIDFAIDFITNNFLLPLIFL